MADRDSQSSCPSAEELGHFLAGELEPELHAAIAKHLDHCRICQQQTNLDASEQLLADDIRWAARTTEQTSVTVNVPLARLSELLPDYEVLGEIGRGGMGIVYQARHRKLDRIVALKVLPALLGVVRPDAIARFRREAALAARLKHTNIITVHDYDEVDGTLYYAMELVEGRSLREVLSEIEQTGAIDVVIGEATRRRDSEAKSDSGIPNPESQITRLGSSSATDRRYYRRVAEWTAEVAEALHYAHGRGVIHRDVKPSNLLLADDGRMMISDFGLAKAVAGGTPGESATVTTSQALLGTARYMSPEQVSPSGGGDDGGRDGDGIDARVDVYGLGATLYELLAFRPMFAAADDREVLDHVLNREPTPPRRFVRQVPRELETICLKAVEKDRNARYATAKELRDDLERWLLDLPIHAKRPSLAARTMKLARRRKLPVALGIAATCLLVIAAFLYVGYSSSQRAARRSASLAADRQTEVIRRDAVKDQLAGDFNAALEKLDAGLAQDPDAVELLRLRADILHHLGRDGEALAIYEELLARNPDDWETHYSLTFLLIGCDEFRTESQADPTSLARTMPDDERRQRLAYHREQVLRLQPDSAEACYVRAKLETDPQRAIELLGEALQHDPTRSEALLQRARLYQQLGDYEAMLLDAERGVARHPGWGVFHGQRGLALASLGRHAEAVAAYSTAIGCEPDCAVWWHQRGLEKGLLGRHAEALSDANRAIELDPNFAYAYVGRARAQAGLGRTDMAMTDFDRGLQLVPCDIEIYMERGAMHFNAGNLETAAADMGRVIELRPDDARAYGNRAIVYIVMKRYDRAISDLTTCIELDPDNAKAWRNRGHARDLNGQYAESIADFTRAMELEPSQPGDLSSRANLLICVGRYEDAVADLTRLLEINPSPATLMQRGMAYELVDAPRLALADYQRVSQAGGRSGAYGRLWRHILLREIGEADKAATLLILPDVERHSGAESQCQPTDAPGDAWTVGLFNLFSDTLTPNELLAAAATDDERAEAYYYTGRKALLDADRDAARAAFEACVALDRDGVLESDFARALLRRLESP